MRWYYKYLIFLITALVCAEIYPDPLCWFVIIGVAGGVGIYSAFKQQEEKK